MVLTIDVEDWFSVRNMGIPIADWNRLELRVRHGLDFILTELNQRSIKATFFVLGWIAEKCPDIVVDLASQGHEIASHGYDHQSIETKTPESFRLDVKRSLEILSSQTDQPIKGYRAPSFSVTRKTAWSLPILSDLGFEYDSSIYPIHHPNYGIPGSSKAPVMMGEILEFPLSVATVGGLSIPISGGGYFRLYPYKLTSWLLRRLEKPEPILYFHPWEFDEDQPRVRLPLINGFRHYVGLRKNRQKFRQLLDDFTFRTLGELNSRREKLCLHTKSA